MCGIVGIFGHPEAAWFAHLALFGLQHRGQESAGIVSDDRGNLHRYVGMGHVREVFTESALRQLPGTNAIGHVRYSTAGGSVDANAQPFLFQDHRGPIAIGHNGNLVNASKIRKQLVASGSILQTTSDTETILHLAARSRTPDVAKSLVVALRQLQGAYSIVALAPNCLIAARDPHGFRPLSLGRLDRAWVIASETCVFSLIGATHVRDVDPGEVVVLNSEGCTATKPFKKARPAPCIFEHVYFARPDSRVFGQTVIVTRKRLGEQLWREHPAAVDIVVPVPDSGNFAAQGFADAAGKPFEMGLVRNHYAGRTFIEPDQRIRSFRVRVKLSPVSEILEGRRIALVDDSIVRGTTSREIVQRCRDAGATEVHMRISCPPTIWPCVYGIDTPRKQELIASQHSVDEIARILGVDSIGYLSLAGMLKAGGQHKDRVCTACWTGQHPIAL